MLGLGGAPECPCFTHACPAWRGRALPAAWGASQVGRAAPAGTLWLLWDGTSSGPSHESLFPLAFLSDKLFPPVMLPYLSAGDRHQSRGLSPLLREGGQLQLSSRVSLLSSWLCCSQRLPGTKGPRPPHVLAEPWPRQSALGPLLVLQAGHLLDILSDLRGEKSFSQC